MAGNQSDIDIRATITTEADLKGVDSASKAVDDMGKSTSQATAAQTEGAEAASKAITDIGEAASKTAGTQVETAGEVNRKLQDQEEALDKIHKQLEAMEAAAEKAYGQQVQKATELEVKNKELITQSDQVKAKYAEVGKAAIKTNQDVLASVNWLQTEWAKYAQVVSGLFGALGLIKQAGAEVKAAWDGFHYEQIRQAQAHHNQLVKLAEQVQTLNAAYDQARVAKEDLAATRLQQMDEDKVTSRYAQEARDIEAAGDALIRYYQLEASLNNNQQEHTRIELDRKLYKGEIGQADYDKFNADRTVGEKQDARNNEHAQVSGEYAAAQVAATQATNKLADATQDYERIVRNPKYMDAEAYTKSQRDRGIAERELRGAPKNEETGMPEIKGLLGRWNELRNRLVAAERRMQAAPNIGVSGGGMAQAAARGEAEKIKKEMESILNSIQKNKGIIATADAKKKDFEALNMEQTYTKDPVKLWDKADRLGEKMQGLVEPVEVLGKVADDLMVKLENLEKVQAGQQDNDNLERKYKMEQIAAEEKKKKEEEVAAAITASNEKIESLKSGIEKLGKSASGADEAMRESMTNQLEEEIFNRNALQSRQRGEAITSRVPGQVEDIMSLIQRAEDQGAPYPGADQVESKLRALLSIAKDGRVDKRESVQIDRYIQEIANLIRTDGSNDMTRELVPLFNTVKSLFQSSESNIKRVRAEVARMQTDLANLSAQSANNNS